MHSNLILRVVNKKSHSEFIIFYFIAVRPVENLKEEVSIFSIEKFTCNVSKNQLFQICFMRKLLEMPVMLWEELRSALSSRTCSGKQQRLEKLFLWLDVFSYVETNVKIFYWPALNNTTTTSNSVKYRQWISEKAYCKRQRGFHVLIYWFPYDRRRFWDYAIIRRSREWGKTNLSLSKL